MKHHLITPENPSELVASLEALLHGYLTYAFQLGINWQEAMCHYEIIRLLIHLLTQVGYGDQRDQSAA